MAKTAGDQAGASLAPNLGHGVITAVMNSRTVAIDVESGGAIRAVLPGHVIPGQVTSALAQGPLKVAYFTDSQGAAFVWAVYPTAEQAEAFLEFVLDGRRVVLRSGKAMIELMDGSVTVRGQEITTRSAGECHLMAPRLRFN